MTISDSCIWEYRSNHPRAAATMAWFLFGRRPLLVRDIQEKREVRLGVELLAIFGVYYCDYL